MSKSITIDRDHARDVIAAAFSYMFTERVAKRLAARAIDAIEKSVAPKASPEPTELDRARARDLCRRAGLRVRGSR